MRIDGAIIREQNVTFAIVVVKPQVLTNDLECESVRRSFRPYFPGMPIILMAQVSGRNRYHGRNDIVQFLAKIDQRRIPWKTYTFS
jgi:hypothetical protein